MGRSSASSKYSLGNFILNSWTVCLLNGILHLVSVRLIAACGRPYLTVKLAMSAYLTPHCFHYLLLPLAHAQAGDIIYSGPEEVFL